jgi:hypothetical protein
VALIKPKHFTIGENMEKPKEVPSVTKPVGGLGDERKESAYKKKSAFREEPFQGPSKGGYHNVGSAAKKTPSKGDERVRPGGDKADYSKYTKDQPFKESSTGQGYKNVGSAAKKTPSKGAERTEGAYKKKSPWRNA